ncbi:hypothetical protein SCP_0100320 [Sparassis crispa]|uniref:Uncharacterized protein n=1 Tax=Sparassis crispa TaxID=139825 RepID=A0A401G4S8_9APHY|nr:hypothetical protein SCP_0100320 [Sparassis crispa]GBE77160.1 hypothetical protein SCP_0100320 [Sparassis crispa]
MAPNRLIEDLSARHNLPAMASDAEPPDTLDITMGESDEEDSIAEPRRPLISDLLDSPGSAQISLPLHSASQTPLTPRHTTPSLAAPFAPSNSPHEHLHRHASPKVQASSGSVAPVEGSRALIPDPLAPAWDESRGSSPIHRRALISDSTPTAPGGMFDFDTPGISPIPRRTLLEATPLPPPAHTFDFRTPDTSQLPRRSLIAEPLDATPRTSIHFDSQASTPMARGMLVDETLDAEPVPKLLDFDNSPPATPGRRRALVIDSPGAMPVRSQVRWLNSPSTSPPKRRPLLDDVLSPPPLPSAPSHSPARTFDDSNFRHDAPVIHYMKGSIEPVTVTSRMPSLAALPDELPIYRPTHWKQVPGLFPDTTQLLPMAVPGKTNATSGSQVARLSRSFAQIAAEADSSMDDDEGDSFAHELNLTEDMHVANLNASSTVFQMGYILRDIRGEAYRSN